MENKTNQKKVIYTGNRKDLKVEVWVLTDQGGHLLDPRRSFDIRRHSPTGFEWGYAGSGPAQLALAILLDFTDDAERAEKFYQRFKFEKIATLPHDDWRITGREIHEWLNSEELSMTQQINREEQHESGFDSGGDVDGGAAAAAAGDNRGAAQRESDGVVDQRAERGAEL